MQSGQVERPLISHSFAIAAVEDLGSVDFCRESEKEGRSSQQTSVTEGDLLALSNSGNGY